VQRTIAAVGAVLALLVAAASQLGFWAAVPAAFLGLGPLVSMLLA
jgi:hypothetical protein